MATSTQEWIDELKGISVLELAERIKALEEEFGVSATALAKRRSRRRSTSC
jgi:large subunit ribosomal protein L7/L12